jgi:hypothetical protein
MKNALIIIMILFNSPLLISQNSGSLDQLMNKKWKMHFISPKEYTATDFYTADTKTATFEFRGEKAELKYRYYLSDVIVNTFNEANVGKINNGRYIIAKNLSTGELHIYEIMEISNYYLKLRVLQNNSFIEFYVN